MSKPSRRAHRRSRHERGASPHETFATQCSMTTIDDPVEIEEAMRLSHDQLIAALGSRRRSGVTWQVIRTEGFEEALRVLEGPEDHIAREYSGGIPILGPMPLGAYDDVRQWKAEHPDAVLVIALAQAADPRVRTR